MNDIFGQIVLAAGDKDLVARNRIGPIRILYRPSFQCAHIRTGTRFGEQHGAPPLAGIDLFQEQFLLLGGSEKFDHFGRTMTQVAEASNGKICADDILEGRLADDPGKSLAADFRVFSHGNPFALCKKLVRTMKALRHGHPAIVKLDAFTVALRISRQNFFDAQIARLGDDHVKHFAVQIIVFFCFNKIFDL